MRDRSPFKNYRHLFGPVPSRRLGVSLGIDLVDTTCCTLNCVYCECGETSVLSLERGDYVPAAGIIAELNDLLSDGPKLDYLTFGGSGEPTLNTGIGEVARWIKRSFPGYKCALLTNGTLFDVPEVRRDCADFDLVLPSLDAASQETFEKINRPAPGLAVQTVTEGLVAFRREYAGMIWLEVFIVPGINDTESELRLLKQAITAIAPDRVQLNTLDRPGACDWVVPASLERLQEIAALFSPLPVEIISRQAQNLTLWNRQTVSPETVRSLLARRPSTIEEIATLTGLTINETAHLLEGMIKTGAITTHTVNHRTFFRIF
ncbi:MAG: radical SAM protein [Chitinispirillaceae bacterium]|nr:radical SAM protein [Chitinispirillaceae bacterium]